MNHRPGRTTVLVICTVLLLGLLPGDRARAVVPAVSPYMSFCSAIALRSLGFGVYVSLPVLVLCLVVRRGFCRHLCPVGMLAELAGRASASGNRRFSFPRIGDALATAGLAGALFGYPALLWLDPLALFAGAFSVLHAPLTAGACLSAAGLAVILIASGLLPGIWCGRVCPLGGFQDLLAIPRRLVLRPGTDPTHSGLNPHAGTDPVRPHGNSRVGTDPERPGRREAVVALTGAAIGTVWAALTSTRAGTDPTHSGLNPHAVTDPVRPPGAVPEARFGSLCVRCGNCVRVCPSRILVPDSGRGGVFSILTPTTDFSSDYCREDCCACGAVCPSGAIARIALSDKPRTRMGIAEVLPDRCLLVAGRECPACVNACPYDAIRVITDPDDPYRSMPVVDAFRCNGCGACEAACPAFPQRAIAVTSRRDRSRRGGRLTGMTGTE